MVNLSAAIRFISEHGNDLEQARLGVLLQNENVSLLEAVSVLRSEQREDGSWASFWSGGASSVDATCYRLAQCEQLGLNNEDFIQRALTFLTTRQLENGSFSECRKLAPVAPPWVQPDDPSAIFYLTANAGFWLQYFNKYPDNTKSAVEFLISNINIEGYLSTFLHANWLAAGLFYSANEVEHSTSIMNYLESKLTDLSASNLAWLINALVIMGVPKHMNLIVQGVDILRDLQHEQGYWLSEDGDDYNVHTTLESIRAFRICS
ncbi:hypothetical protein BVG16_21040 [Paenibacillus selenitireducens]|uniref:Squalene cyclase C-terminal domain-containing protein n=1 Tax=Paenibacillus selenitireducens TaxID=1324314 RepID=A0A1T2X5G7_9BACL|nr:prenyltransferase/squalene oxidase repeat-containing protein [Paenibacillus selenitireducens]OPA75100.1 hypothetical protein BVG16_21040 [Paenibacillus selenitireducens]